MLSFFIHTRNKECRIVHVCRDNSFGSKKVLNIDEHEDGDERNKMVDIDDKASDHNSLVLGYV